MSCDLTWLLLKPGRTIRARDERGQPPDRYQSTSHAVVVGHDAEQLWSLGRAPDRART